MFKNLGALVFVVIALSAFVVPPASAGVPRVVVAEEYGATW